MQKMHSTPIFALDIGTRSVVGIIVTEENGVYQITDYVMHEHQERSMLDGQIHDVIAVSEVIQKVKTALEEKHGLLKKVAVAAAGRSLKTKRSHITHSIGGRPLLTRQDVLAMELEAVQVAQAELANEMKDEQQTNYYCVGYSVIHYQLDQEIIGNLIDQRGKEATVEVISTFLPRVVVDSLISALKRAGLEMEALTLEPIAAINVLIPPTMRRLNVTLVDIGAGTSDIAITSEGAIVAYGMVPCAGDEITEALSNQYLLDFPVAEDVKRKLYNQEEVTFEDILGVQYTFPSHEVIKAIQPAIQQLAEQISKEIMLLNGKAPQAVMLIGGGSLTPTLGKWIASVVDLPENRVGVRGLSTNQHLQIETDVPLKGPEAVTPIGIAIAAKQHPIKYLSVTVNQTTARLFDLRELTISDAILASGLNIKKFHGKPGLALSVLVHNKVKYIPGTHGSAPVITCNGQGVELDTSVSENDEIQIVKGKDGEDAIAYIKDVIADIQTLDFELNGQVYSLPPSLSLNGISAGIETKLKERDEVHIHLPTRLLEILEQLQWDLSKVKPTKLSYFLNKEPKWIELAGTQIFINGQTGSFHSEIRNGDHILLQEPERKLYTIRDIILEEYQKPEEIHVIFNNQPVAMLKAPYYITKNGQPATLDDMVQEGAHIQIEPATENSSLLFNDVFRFIDIGVQNPEKGSKMVLRVNGQSASFDTPIHHGDTLELKWEK